MINNFAFEQATSIEDALRLLSQPGRSVPIVGGTNVLVYLKRDPLEADRIIDLSRLEALQGIADDNGRISIGAGVTFTQLLEWNPGGSVQSLLKPMCENFAGPLTRNLATVGGNICDGSPAADISPPLLALDATVTLVSASEGERSLPISEFFLGVRKTARREDELVTSIEFDMPGDNARAFYYKLGKRKADAISIVSIAMLVELDGEIVKKARIALGAVAPVAMRAVNAESQLLGHALEKTTIDAGAAAAAEESQPIDDFRASGKYRRQMVEELVRRGLNAIATA